MQRLKFFVQRLHFRGEFLLPRRRRIREGGFHVARDDVRRRLDENIYRRVALGLLKPGVPVPGENAGSTTSMSRVK